MFRLILTHVDTPGQKNRQASNQMKKLDCDLPDANILHNSPGSGPKHFLHLRMIAELIIDSPDGDS